MRNPTNPKGFTLIEVLVSLCAMAFAFVALWALHLSSLKVDSKTNHETQATLMANQKLEEARATASTDFSKLSINANTFKSFDTIAGIYTQTMTIVPLASWRKDVTVTLTWPEQIKLGDGGKSTTSRSVQLSTIVTNLELN